MKWHIREKFKGFFASAGISKPQARKLYPMERAWFNRCKYYDAIFLNHPLAKSQILTLAGQLVADGIFLQPSTEDEPHGERAKDAVTQCEDLNKELNIPHMLYDTVVYLAKYGSCFWEITTDPQFNARIIPMQECLEPAQQNEQGDITTWRQNLNGTITATWPQDEIIHFAWNISTYSWPYGTSLLTGLDTEFDILEQLEADVKEYMHKQAFPKELWQVGDGQYMPTGTEAEEIKSLVKNWQPGQAHISTYKIDYQVGGTGDREIKSLDKVLAYLKEECIDGLMTPPLSYQYNSTYASSKEMAKMQRANLILPMQRLIGWKLEQEVYKPYLEALGYSVKLTPSVNWDPPDANFVEEVTAYTQLVGSGILTPEVAAEELGYGDRLEEMKQQKLERQQQQMELMKQRANTFGQGQQKQDQEQKPNAERIPEENSKQA